MMTHENLIKEEEPREKFASSTQLASIVDLVAILLRTGTKGNSVMELSRQVVDFLVPESGITGFEDLNWRDLLAIKGIGPAKAISICAAIELGRRLSSRFDKNNLFAFHSPEDVSSYFMEKLRHDLQEHFIGCYLNTKNRLLGYQVITTGSLNQTPVDIRETIRWGLRYKAAGMILVHNHPSGDPHPSQEDLQVTKKIYEAAKLFDIAVLDHIIIGDGVFVSLRALHEI